MSTNATLNPLQPGAAAPEFTLPAVHRDGTVSIAQYRGRRPLFLALFAGLYCPFCRRGIAQVGSLCDRLDAAGVDTLGVVATELDNARLYFKYRPSRFPLGADPQFNTHRAYGVDRVQVDEDMMRQLGALNVNPTGELPQPMPLPRASDELDRIDGYQRTPADQRDIERQWPLLKAQFMIDREGIVRWANVEGSKEGLAGLGKFPSDAEILSVVDTVM